MQHSVSLDVPVDEMLSEEDIISKSFLFLKEEVKMKIEAEEDIALDSSTTENMIVLTSSSIPIIVAPNPIMSERIDSAVSVYGNDVEKIVNEIHGWESASSVDVIKESLNTSHSSNDEKQGTGQGTNMRVGTRHPGEISLSNCRVIMLTCTSRTLSPRQDIFDAGINNASHGKGHNWFLHSLNKNLQLIKQQKLQVPSRHALEVGSDMNVQTKFEAKLHDYVSSEGVVKYMTVGSSLVEEDNRALATAFFEKGWGESAPWDPGILFVEALTTNVFRARLDECIDDECIEQHQALAAEKKEETKKENMWFMLMSDDEDQYQELTDTESQVTSLEVRVANVLDRDGKYRVIPIDATEYTFKLFLLQKRDDYVMSMIRSSQLCGQAVLACLQQKGFPEVALHFVRYERTHFNLALDNGNIQIVVATAKESNEKDHWYRLGIETLRQGNSSIVEFAYQWTVNFERLSVLYLVTGNKDKLSKMLRIAEMKNVVDLLDGLSFTMPVQADENLVFPSITAFESNFLMIMLSFTIQSDKLQVLVIEATFMNMLSNVTWILFFKQLPKLVQLHFNPDTKKWDAENIGSATCKRDLFFLKWDPVSEDDKPNCSADVGAVDSANFYVMVWDPGIKLSVH